MFTRRQEANEVKKYSTSLQSTVEDVNINEIKKLIQPTQLKNEIPVSSTILSFVNMNRMKIKNILEKKDNRKLVIVGPCSIHNINMAKEYGLFIKSMIDKYSSKLMIVMRVYFEKPRTTVGWKGLINDPHLDNSFDINNGLRMARELLIFLNQIGVPCGYEILDTFTPQYIGDLVSWGAIGARTTESQVHRQLVSGLSMPVGFKNNSSGDIEIAKNAILSAAYPHCFYGINNSGQASIVHTRGNKNTHIILRGSKWGTNYDIESLNRCIKIMETADLIPNIMVDCSHGNSGKHYKNQKYVVEYCIEQEKKKRGIVMGFMLESNLVEGNQKLIFGEKDKLEWGKSITDSCIGLEETDILLYKIFLI